MTNIRTKRKYWEIRKTLPNFAVPFKVLCCETKSGGKIKAEFVCDYIQAKSVDEIDDKLLKQSCVERSFLEEYTNGRDVFLFHVSEMVDYCNDKGRKVLHLSDFGIEKVPQSWCYVKEKM